MPENRSGNFNKAGGSFKRNLFYGPLNDGLGILLIGGCQEKFKDVPLNRINLERPGFILPNEKPFEREKLLQKIDGKKKKEKKNVFVFPFLFAAERRREKKNDKRFFFRFRSTP